ncbi:MAG: thioesterase family protein [Myxococcales bacterium]|nr:thioesterase family protein [Myxococcales bacterium]MCB9705386.1 thioesterase family protein [Myxococcales bacterium]
MGERASFYVADGDRLIGTDYTRGPWSVDHQHGGPPTAAIARALTRAVDDDAWALARVTFELLRPVTLAPLRIALRELGRSRSTRRFTAALEVDGREAIVAQALLLRRHEVTLPALAPTPQPPPPEASEPLDLPLFDDRPGYHRAFEIRRAAGRYGRGQLSAWMRATVDLVAGEAITPLERVMVAADSCNGLSAAVDPRAISFVSGDLTVHVARPMRGEWLCVAAESVLDGAGVGVASGRLHDVEGTIGAVSQSLVVRDLRASAPAS